MDLVYERKISLLFPRGKEEAAKNCKQIINEQAVKDLDIDNMIERFCPDNLTKQERTFFIGYIRKNLLTSFTDVEIITYRQDVMEDLLNNPGLIKAVRELQPKLILFEDLSSHSSYDDLELLSLAKRVTALEAFAKCIEELLPVFTTSGVFRSQGFNELKEYVIQVSGDPTFQQLVKNLPELQTNVRQVSSITVGINLDERMRASEATLVSINKNKITSSPFLGKVFGNPENQYGISRMHKAYEEEYNPIEKMLGLDKMAENGLGLSKVEEAGAGLKPLFRDLDVILRKTTKDAVESIVCYSKIKTNTLLRLNNELRFYLGAVNFINKITETGLPMCRPRIVDKQERSLELKDTFNLNLVFDFIDQKKSARDNIVTNSLSLDNDGRIVILTGPNRGGKTVFIHAVSLGQILAQAGLYIPGTAATVSPVDAIYTHYQIEERPGEHTGRLGDEAKRFYDIFENISRYSLLISNESLSSTNDGESLYIAEDLLGILSRAGARVLFATHLHELAKNVDRINTKYEGESKLISMVSQVKDGINTFKIVKSPPMGHSYARELAKKYGIGYDQLETLLTKKGVL